MSEPANLSPVPSARREWRLVLGAALAAAALSTFFFAPRFIVWRAFGVPALGGNIEIFRSPWSLAQVAHPFDKIENASNIVIQWRLLFPLLAHYLHLPLPVLLALPWIGCLLALVMMAHLLWTYTGDTGLVWMGTMLAATCSWYLVGTGWVLYFDGWLMMTLLLATFGRSGWHLLLTAFLAPWIDERFVLTVPLCLAVRWAVLSPRGDYPFRNLVRDTGLLAAGLAPYLGIRLWALKAHVWQPEHGFFESFFTNGMGFNSPYSLTLIGLWHGLRAAWLPVLVFAVWFWRRQGARQGLALVMVMVVTMTVQMGLAGDLSRSASVILPAMLAGVMAAPDWPAAWGRRLLMGVCALNYLLPTIHLITSTPVSKIPIYYLHTELGQLRQPPDQFNPQFYNLLGQQAMQVQKVQEAFNHFSTAIGLDPRYADALINRGVLLYKSNHKTEALEDFSRAIEAEPRSIKGWLNRGLARQDMGDRAGATADLQAAMAAADQAVEREPKSLEVWMGRSQLREQLGNPAGAAADLEKVIELAPPDWTSLGDIRLKISTLKAAATKSGP
ncbi:MAG: tetratricopeptide repeat protein [Verrucomicrobiota bacterium]